MDLYVAFLRGMNLGNRRIKNPELAAEFEQLGFVEVATFRASGNVIFGVEGREKRAALGERIETGLLEGLGYDVPVYLRSAAEVVAIAAQEPFPPTLLAHTQGKLRVKAPTGKLQVTMLREKPTAAARKKVLALSSDEDRLAIDGTELYWLPSGGISESDLDLKAIEVALGPGTQRTIGTIEQIASKYCG